MSKVFITGASAISAQPTFGGEGALGPRWYEAHPLMATIPDISSFVPPMQARRMTRLVKLGIAAGMDALKKAGVQKPGAVIVGTGDGCKQSTERFLNNMIEHDEQVPDPTAFIGSTHNGVAGQIAMAVDCKGYNYTYLHAGLSFPSALADGLLQVREGQRNVLVGGVDVITPGFITTQASCCVWRAEARTGNRDVLDRPGPGALAGEGSAYFVLDSEPNEAPVEVLAAGLYQGLTATDFLKEVRTGLHGAGLETDHVDAVLTGLCGDTALDADYPALIEPFPNAGAAAYKHLTGEYYTANALGTWFLWDGLRSGQWPAAMVHKPIPVGATVGLLLDHFRNNNRSFVLLRKSG
ncbi:MAG: beta-ketoacyl synthase chain length factor [Flavobacteriales bacterium]|nr:MAG: beta-ketoacyl synthase chain length factor [Flavobacteriales bacterium]